MADNPQARQRQERPQQRQRPQPRPQPRPQQGQHRASRGQPAADPAELSSRPPDHNGLLIASVIMMLIGWVGLYQLVTTTLPRIGGELWLFFLLLMIAVTGTAIPFVRYFNVLLTPAQSEVPTGGVIVRQSVWVGLFAVACAWLQIPRALTVPLAIFIAVLFLVVEVFLRTREIAALRED